MDGNIKRRNRLIVLIISLLVLASLVIAACKNFHPYEIMVNGKPIAKSKSLYTAKKIVKMAISSSIRGSSLDIKIPERITFHKSDSSNIMPVSQAVSEVERNISTKAVLHTILANDKPVAAFKDFKDAEAAIDKLKGYYDKLPGKVKDKPKFIEKIRISKKLVSIDIAYKTADEAVKFLTTDSQPPVFHLVKKGEYAWDIAEKYDITIPDLAKLNPDINFNDLTENQNILIKPGIKPINVISKRNVITTTTVELPRGIYRRSRSGGGERVTNTLITYMNDQPIDSMVISQLTTWNRPKTRKSSSYHRKSRKSNTAAVKTQTAPAAISAETASPANVPASIETNAPVETTP